MKIYNTMSRSIEEFVPLEEGKVKLYTCGPTVYHYAHIGNLRGFLFYDTLKRTLTQSGFHVEHVMNITDVGHLTDDADYGEDKLEKGALREGKSVWEVAAYFTNAFLDDVHKLHIIPPTYQPKATAYIKEQLEMIVDLERHGYTYRTNQGIVFDTSKFADYAKLSRMPMDKLIEGARVETDPEKRNPTDFYLWKFSGKQNRQMEWDSPWGVGFPGWHLECSAMARALLGKTIDIHCGGIDHIPVHHTNEIAQSEGANYAQFARYWMHNNFLTLEAGLKMSKSADNFLRMQSVIDQGYHPLAYRYMCLTAHYRSELIFGWEQLAAAQQTLRKIKQLIYGHQVAEQGILETNWVEKFVGAMEKDLDTPLALSTMHEMLSSSLSEEEKRAHLLFFDRYLGLGLSEDLHKMAYLSDDELERIEIGSSSAAKLLRERETARKNKDWQSSDRLRDQLKSAGLEIEDAVDGMRIPRGMR